MLSAGLYLSMVDVQPQEKSGEVLVEVLLVTCDGQVLVTLHCVVRQTGVEIGDCLLADIVRDHRAGQSTQTGEIS